ncbi:MAG TPA: amidophosphoribosyltransferase [Candidatus Blautia merdavium]|uniref:Amidophosphoribosyltransferase n=1 Tax=Candidatus Blautia merdavium TaxID=2838494 RepID=A0A9D2PML2_9FIRM|nr:amidophosphoribosyltransferase [Candidatus Blautia merdavium]
MEFDPSYEIKEACGVFGIYDFDGNNTAADLYCGLNALQHRGQESCGMAVSDTSGPKGNIQSHKGMGLVSEVFKEDTLASLHGNLGIGHVRYSTTGAAVVQNAQPLVLNYMKGTLALAHNGNLVNAGKIRARLEQEGVLFHTTTDSEVIACCIARERVHCSCVEEAIKKTASIIQGAYGLVIASPRKLIGVRDPLGLKPLCLGKRGNAWILASESCALASVGADFVRDIRPGEILTITSSGLSSDFTLCREKQAHCIFEYIYFARLDSTLDGINIYDARIRAGAALARSYPVEADMVCGVPESGIPAAKGYSEESGIPFGFAFYKNSYVGRTFIKPTQKERENSVRMKLSVLESAVKGKRIVLVDDSIVRGTTMANLIHMLKEAGAKSVHVRVSSPPFLYPCYFGTDIPSNRQLIASSHSSQEICSMIGADSLGYMKIDDLPYMTQDLPLCTACFSGQYPMDVS